MNLYSVTSLQKIALGTSDALINWAVNTTAEFAIDNAKSWSNLDREAALDLIKRARYRKSGAAMARGTNLHKAAESLALGVQPVDVGKVTLPYVEQYARFLSEHAPTFEMSEAPVYSPRYGYAGTLDGIALIDGQRVVFDVKTTDKAPDSGKSRPPYPEVALQLVAYRRAEFVGVLSEQRYAGGKRYYVFDEKAEHELMPETDGAVCIVVSPFDYQVVPIRTDDAVWTAWLHVIECARWQLETSRTVIGPAISPKVRVAA